MPAERVGSQAAVRVQLGQGQSASAGDVHDLLAQARQLFPGRSLQGFEFRLKAGTGGAQFLELRKQTGWGAFKEAMGIGQATRDAERRNALNALPAAYLNGANAQQALNRDAARALVSRTETAVAIESDSARIAANPMGSLLAAYSAGERFEQFEFAECLARVANSFGMPLDDGSGVSRPERITAATVAMIAPRIDDLSNDQLAAVYRTFVDNMPMMAGGSWADTATELVRDIIRSDESVPHPLLDSQELSEADREAKAMEYANLLTDLGAVAVAVQETVVSKMMSRNVLTRLEPGRDLYEFQGQRIDYEQILPGRCPDFISRLANRANEKGSVLEALLEMKAESLAGRAS